MPVRDVNSLDSDGSNGMGNDPKIIEDYSFTAFQ